MPAFVLCHTVSNAVMLIDTSIPSFNGNRSVFQTGQPIAAVAFVTV